MSEAAIEVQALCKVYGKKHALKDVNFSIKKGEFAVLIGPNGAGKSTLMRILDLLESPTGGKMFFWGEDALKLPEERKVEIRRRIGVVFQNPAVFNDSVYENIAYGLRIRGSGKNMEEKVKRTAELVGLSVKEHALRLSGGKMQLLALARALVIEPEIMLLDEPTSSLDPGNAVVFGRTIKKMNEEGKTIVLSTHDMFQARRLAQKIVFMLDGEIIEVGDKSIFEEPQDSRTRAFVNGEMSH